MKAFTRFSKIQFLLIALLIVAALPGIAQAYLICRSDPVVKLSNGMTLDLSASISTLPTQVRTVHYELHVPVGISMIAVHHTSAWPASQETFSFYADQPAGSYNVITSVSTTKGDARIDANAMVVSQGGGKLGTYSVSGVEGQRLSLFFHT